MKYKYPEDSAQFFCNEWWKNDDSREVKRGTLISAYVPHVDQIPNILTPIGRTEAAEHTSSTYILGPLAIGSKMKRSSLPIAALPTPIGEELTVYRSKKRPMLILGGGYSISEDLRRGKPKRQTSPTILAAPYYGINHGDKRSGYNPELVQRVRRCEYPHYIWDHLPHNNGVESLLRLDHIQPIGYHHKTFGFIGYVLSDEALIIIDNWINWFLYKSLNEDSMLMEIRRELLKM